MKGEAGSLFFPALQGPFDIPHREACRKGQPVMTTTNLLTLPGAIKLVRCFFAQSAHWACLDNRQRHLPASQEAEQNAHALIARNAGGKKDEEGKG